MTNRQREREIEEISKFYNEDASSTKVREVSDFLSRTDRAIAAARTRGGDYTGESGEYDPSLYEAANRAAALRRKMKSAAKQLATRKRAYALRAKRPTRGNLGARIADLETLRSSTRGDERARYEQDLKAARLEWSRRDR